MAAKRHTLTQWNVHPGQRKIDVYYRDAVTGGSNLYAEVREESLGKPVADATGSDILAALDSDKVLKLSESAVEIAPAPVAEPEAGESL